MIDRGASARRRWPEFVTVCNETHERTYLRAISDDSATANIGISVNRDIRSTTHISIDFGVAIDVHVTTNGGVLSDDYAASQPDPA